MDSNRIEKRAVDDTNVKNAFVNNIQVTIITPKRVQQRALHNKINRIYDILKPKSNTK